MSVQVNREGQILVIRLDRVQKRNAIDAAMTAGIDAALNLLDDDRSLRVGVIVGSGGIFSAGTDMRQSAGPPTDRGGEYGLIRRARRKPLIAVVEGYALGGGMEIVLACDLVVAARGSYFGLPEVKRGVVASCGGLFRAQRALPLPIAKQLLLTGEPLTAERAHQLGLVNELAEPGEAAATAMELARQICRNAPTSVSESLQAVERSASANDDAGWDSTERAVAAILESVDFAEGIAAFLERRAPLWSDDVGLPAVRLSAGQILESTTSTARFVVLVSGVAAQLPSCGGHDMRLSTPVPCSERLPAEPQADEIAVGAVYSDIPTGITVRCVRSGTGPLEVAGRQMVVEPQRQGPAAASSRAEVGSAGRCLT